MPCSSATGNTGFAEVFRHPPLSTQQIMHPEKYFADVKPTEPALPDPHLPHGYKGLVGGSLGELEHSILLEQYAGKEPRRRDRAALARLRLRTAREQEGRPRSAALRRGVGQRRCARASISRRIAQSGEEMEEDAGGLETADSVTGTGDDGRFVLRRNGAIVHQPWKAFRLS